MSAPTRAELHVPAGTAAASGYDLEITPASAGWAWSSLRTLTLGAGERREVVTGDEEMIVVPLSGGVTVGDGDHRVRARRPDRRLRRPHRRRVPPHRHDGDAPGRRAAGPVRADRRPHRGRAARSATCRPPTSPSSCGAPGSAAARCATSVPPGCFEAGNLIAVEVITPGGNWSSYPAHKHDEATEHESRARGDLLLRDRARPARRARPRLPPHQRLGRAATSTCSSRSATATPCSCPTAGTGRAPPPPATTCTTSTSWPARASAPGRSPTTPTRPGSAPRGRTSRSIDSRLAGHVMSETVRLTVAQALVRFLGAQYSERDGVEQKLFAGCFGIFGHGNVAGIGQALLEAELAEPELLPYVLGRNEQAMVHSAAAYTRMKDRLQTWAVSTSVGPGATNMVTGAALATINRLPVLLLPADTFADRAASPLLQELELPDSGDVTVNDCFRPVSRYFDRVWRPEQLPSAMLAAMRVLTDPAETGAVTVCFPQDVQAQAHDWPVELFAKRVWHVARPAARAGRARRGPRRRSARARRPLVVAGGGVHYSRRDRGPRRVLRGHRHPRRPEPGRQGHARLRPPAVPRRDRLHRHHGGQRDRPRRRRRHRDRHPLLRLHHRQPHRLPGPRRPVRQHQRRRAGRGQARRDRGRRRRPRDPRGADRSARRPPRRRGLRGRVPAPRRRVGRHGHPGRTPDGAVRRPAHPERGDRDGQRADRPARRGGLRGRFHAR